MTASPVKRTTNPITNGTPPTKAATFSKKDIGSEKEFGGGGFTVPSVMTTHATEIKPLTLVTRIPTASIVIPRILIADSPMVPTSGSSVPTAAG